MLGLTAIPVLILFCAQARICAKENTVPLTDLQPMENAGELRLVFGGRNLDDKDAFVLFLMAEGFTGEEQEDFFRSVENLTSALMSISPMMNLQT